MADEDKNRTDSDPDAEQTPAAGDAPKAEEPAAKPEPAAAPPREKAPASRGGGSVLATLLSLVAIGVASYPAYMIYMEASNTAPDPVAAEVARLETAQDRLETRLSDLAAQLAAEGDNNAYVDEQVAALDARLAGEIERLREEFGTSSQDWLYAEVEYLIRMANQRALMERDVASALELLTAADAIIREAEGLTAHALREALAQDIARLKAVNEPDVQGIFLELSAQVSQVPALKRSLPVYEAPASMTAEQAAPAGWAGRLQQMVTDAGRRLAELVDFRRGDIEIRPILPPDEEYYLRQNLVLKLQMAQLALLEGNSAVFQASVSEAGTWVGDYFDLNDAASTSMIRTLDALAAADISTDIPDISASLKAVRSQLQDFKGDAQR